MEDVLFPSVQTLKRSCSYSSCRKR